MKNEFRTAQRQHINISHYAYKVLQMDAISFTGSNNMSGFINAIFLNFYHTAEATVSLAIERERTILRNALLQEKYIKSHPKDTSLQYYTDDFDLTDAENEILDLQVANYARNLNVRYSSMEKQQVLKIRLQNEVYDIIYPGDDEEWSEAEYYRSPGEYLRVMIEEYTQKTYFEREAVFFKNQLDLLQAAMNAADNNKRILSIIYSPTEGHPEKYNIKPHFLTNKPMSEYHYLIALAAKAGEKNAEYKPKAFRMAWIHDIQERSKSFGSGRIPKAQQAQLEDAMRSKGASYIAEDSLDFKVWLTPTGYNKYIKIAHLRPLPADYKIERDAGGNYILRFRCPERQAYFFFFKLSSDVKILEPEYVAKRFQREHLESYHLYDDLE